MTPAVAPAPPDVDLGRRRFFRQFAGRARPDRGDDGRRRPGAPAGVGRGRGAHPRPGHRRRRCSPASARTEPAATAAAGPTGFRTPFRRGRRRPVPDRPAPAARTRSSRSESGRAGEVAYAIREMVVRGAPAIGQVAAIGLALIGRAGPRVAGRTRGGRPCAARPTRSSTPARRRSTSRWAVDRVMARYEQIGDLSEDGDAIADAMRDEADRDRLRGDDRPRPAGRASASPMLPQPEDRPVRILTHCNTGPLACGQFGTALGDRPGGPPRRPPGPRLGRRDAAVPAGRPADGLGAGPGRRAAHADPRRGRRPPDGARRGRRRPRRRGPGRGQRRHGQQDRHVHRWPSWPPATGSRSTSARRRARSTSPRPTARPSRSRSARPRRSRSIRGVAHRAAGDRRPQPGLRRHARPS